MPALFGLWVLVQTEGRLQKAPFLLRTNTEVVRIRLWTDPD